MEPARALLPYLQRADELQNHDRLAAYYCRLYAMEKGLRIPVKERTSETKAILISLMNQLEKDKKVVKLSPDDNMYMEGFALRVFAKADKQDRAGRADLKTAMTFYAASIFFEVLLQFGELPPDIQEKQKYASWKAADIRKALAEGKKPVPGPPVNEKDVEADSTWGTEGITNSAPEPSQQPMSPPKDSTFRATSIDNRNYTQSPQPMSPPKDSAFRATSIDNRNYTQSPHEDFNLPSALSNPIPPSYGGYPHSSGAPFDPVGAPSNPIAPSYAGYPHSSGAPSDSLGAPSNPIAPSYAGYPHSAGTPFDSLGGSPTTTGTHSYPWHAPPAAGYNSFQQDPQQQQPHWPAGSSSGGHQPQYPGAPRHTEPASRHSEPASRHSEPASRHSEPASESYQLNGSYDSEYKPSAGTIAEAHKASRFAVSALAFDDVPTAISYLRKSLELLTSPSATVD